jgi:Na+/H+ antiporter NhaD/arsenite permease-like protein
LKRFIVHSPGDIREGFIGCLGMISATLYGDLGSTLANVMVGLISALVDNIPVMFAVLAMNPVCRLTNGFWSRLRPELAEAYCRSEQQRGSL